MGGSGLCSMASWVSGIGVLTIKSLGNFDGQFIGNEFRHEAVRPDSSGVGFIGGTR